MPSYTSFASTLLMDYPEKSPFDIDPPVYNLSPLTREEDCDFDLPEFIAGVNAQWRRTGLNPLYMWYGCNPLIVRDYDLFDEKLPLTSYEQPPPLPRAEFEGPIEFLERLNPRGSSYVFKVRIGGEVRFLKVFPDRDRDEEDEPNLTGMGMLRFRKESEAHAHLLHYGVTKTGSVPHCYGWFDLKKEDVNRIAEFPAPPLEETDDLSYEEVQHLTVTRRPPKGILLEYLADATEITLPKVTAEIADTALRALYNIHAAYVKHGDIRSQNILLLPTGRVVWVDFDKSVCASEHNRRYRINRKDLLDELSECWSYFYTGLLPDRRILHSHCSSFK